MSPATDFRMAYMSADASVKCISLFVASNVFQSDSDTLYFQRVLLIQSPVQMLNILANASPVIAHLSYRVVESQW